MRAIIEIECNFCGAAVGSPCLCNGVPVEYIHERRIYDALHTDMNSPENKERKILKKTIDFECPIISCAAKPGEPCKDGDVFHTLRVLESIKTDMNSEENKIRYGQTDGNGVPLPKRVNP